MSYLALAEGQIVLDRDLNGQSIYPPISVLPSLSRLMKDGIGEGFTRGDHQDVANQLFSSYSKVGDARALASVIGEDELSDTDKQYLIFGRAFERMFIGQSINDNRTIFDTLEIGWKLLGLMPRGELDRVNTKVLDQYYKPTAIDNNGDTALFYSVYLKYIEISEYLIEHGADINIVDNEGYDAKWFADELGLQIKGLTY